MSHTKTHVRYVYIFLKVLEHRLKFSMVCIFMVNVLRYLKKTFIPKSHRCISRAEFKRFYLVKKAMGVNQIIKYTFIKYSKSSKEGKNTY